LPQGFAKSDHGLVPVRCEVWHSWIFVNLDGTAPAFQEYIAPLARRVDHVDFANLHHLATLDLGLVRANWKFIMENSLENYHVPFVHRTTASQPLEDHFDVIDQTCLGTGVKVAGDVASARGDQAPETLDMNALYLGLWPTFIMAAYEPATVVTHLNLPIAADQTYRKVALFTTNKHSVEEKSVKSWCDLEKKVADEDVEVFEAQQAGRSSPATYDGGLLSPRWEIVVAEFRRRIANAMA
jgi:choline monooxygenase